MAGKRERRKKAAKAAPKILKEPSIPSNIEIEYEIEPILIQDEAFQRKFTPSEPIIEPVIAPEIQEYSENEEEDDEDVVKVRKQDSRMSIAYLKSIAPNPAVVDWVDVCAKDPYLLVTLKATRNSVPLPVHWSLKRAYLAAKRGFLKKPFELPEFIRMTGVSELRGDVEKGLKINQRYQHLT